MSYSGLSVRDRSKQTGHNNHSREYFLGQNTICCQFTDRRISTIRGANSATMQNSSPVYRIIDGNCRSVGNRVAAVYECSVVFQFLHSRTSSTLCCSSFSSDYNVSFHTYFEKARHSLHMPPQRTFSTNIFRLYFVISRLFLVIRVLCLPLSVSGGITQEIVDEF